MRDELKQGRATSRCPRALCAALLLALSVAALSGCSYTTEFVVVNDSGSPVEVSYSFKNWREPGDCCPERPAKKPLDRLEDDEAAWRKLRAEEFQFDRDAGVVTVTLAPSEALLVGWKSNWGGHGDRLGDEHFQISSVRIAGSNGTLYYEGRQAQYQFQSQDGKIYRLTYYGWGDKRNDGRR